MMELFFSFFAGAGLYVALFILLLLCGVGNPIPEDLVLITGGYFAYTEIVHLWPTILVCYVGVVLGDVMLYYIGRRYGQKIIGHRRLARILPAERLDRIRNNFRRLGHWAIPLARFLVGLRSPTFLVSGVMHIRFRTFLILDALGALITVPLFVGLGFLFGNNIDVIKHDVRRLGHWAMAAGILLVIGYILYLWRKIRHEETAEEKEKAHFQPKAIQEINE
jgi:membrane protein DedA with SNARE-associated domain